MFSNEDVHVSMFSGTFKNKCFTFFSMTMLQQDIGSKRQITMTTEADSIAGMGKLSYSAC